MRHLMLARSYLLHHKQHQAHETESIAKILEYDGGSDNETIIRLETRQERVYQNGMLKQQQSVNNTFRNPLAEI